MVGYQGEKMSKSLGNLVFPRDLFRDHEPAAVRLALLAHHWRSAWEWDPAELKEAAERLSAWRQACGQPHPLRPGRLPSPTGGPTAGGWGWRAPEPGPGAGGARLPEAVDAALAADLDTPAALAVGDELAERGDGPGVAATAAVLGVELGPARLSGTGYPVRPGAATLPGMRGDKVEVLVDTGNGGVRGFEIVATRSGRRVEVTTSRTMVEVAEVTRTGQPVRTARFLSSRVVAIVEHPYDDGRPAAAGSSA